MRSLLVDEAAVGVVGEAARCVGAVGGDELAGVVVVVASGRAVDPGHSNSPGVVSLERRGRALGVRLEVVADEVAARIRPPGPHALGGEPHDPAREVPLEAEGAEGGVVEADHVAGLVVAVGDLGAVGVAQGCRSPSAW